MVIVPVGDRVPDHRRTLALEAEPASRVEEPDPKPLRPCCDVVVRLEQCGTSNHGEACVSAAYGVIGVFMSFWTSPALKARL